MIEPLSNDSIQYIISRLLDNANDASVAAKESGDDQFLKGKLLAYYEMLDTLRNELEVRDQDLSDYGLNISLEELL